MIKTYEMQACTEAEAARAVRAVLRTGAAEVRVVDDRGGSASWIVLVQAERLSDLPKVRGMTWMTPEELAVPIGWQ